MKAYYYFLFRIYRYYKDKQNENEFQALFSATAVSTVIIYFVLLFAYGILNYFDFIPMINNKIYVIPFILIIGAINHYLFVKEKKFLRFDFHKDRKGGVYIITFIIVLSASFIIIANINREKIFKERRKNPQTEQTKKPASLQSEIENWFKEKF